MAVNRGTRLSHQRQGILELAHERQREKELEKCNHLVAVIIGTPSDWFNRGDAVNETPAYYSELLQWKRKMRA